MNAYNKYKTLNLNNYYQVNENEIVHRFDEYRIEKERKDKIKEVISKLQTIAECTDRPEVRIIR